MLRSLCLLLCSVLLLAGCLPTVQLQGGVLEGEQHWSGRIEIHGDLELAAGARLTIAPGSEIVFYPPGAADLYTEHPHFPGSELIVRGRVTALGRPDRPIIFRAAGSAATAGSWGGVNVMASPEARFDYCRFSGADSALHLQESQASVADSVFHDNRVAIRFHSSPILIEHNRFEANETAIRFHFGAPVIRGNEFIANRKALFVTAYPADYRIEANNFHRSVDYQVVLGEEVPDDLALPHNWWGSADPEAIAAELFDGRRDAHLGRALLEPLAAAPISGAGPRR